MGSEGFGAKLQLLTIVLAFQWGHLRNFFIMETEAVKTPWNIQGFTVYKALAHGFPCEDESFI